ncbi:(R)-citramalate synthase [Desulforamulus reducens MI-1]|uniref:Citramalate synthase n=1 Tax=Desulforamulus reducens (strain ATCC BAA-1160 / DSM 100696 / MI-1) TaxID=349161 RepID=A4J185_DESRM|nr:citramalate synthase [Desulforamulus reducens]ABO48838.1 (R)-citramalate synthase [Desulforamulus reducens MI-1]
MYDTTLRDGTQGEGVSLSAEDKVKIALRLDEMGFQYIEGGWPGSNPKDMEFFQKIQQYSLRNAQVTAFGSTCRPGVEPHEDANINCLLEAGAKIATIFGKCWDFHVTKALNTTLEENLRMVRESVAYLKSKGLMVFFDGEHFFDGYKANADYALSVLKAAVQGGAATVILCDTNGGSMPQEIQRAVTHVVEELPGVELGIHAHNDGEMAVANSIMAVQAGVSQVQGTVNGLGERCGNANLCSIIPNLALKMGYSTIPAENLVYLTELSRYVYELANLNPIANQPFVGESAFAHKGGIHVSALMKEPGTYEHMNPEAVGNVRRVLMSELAGISNLLYKYKELHLDKSSPEGRQVLEKLKNMEHGGYQFEAAEGSLELMLRKAMNGYREPFQLESMRLILEMREENPIHSEAVIKLKVGDQVVHTAAEGNGPVHALDNALRKALETFYPEVAGMRLSDYKVRVLEEKAGTEARVRVLIETGDGKKTWGTVGVSTNIIEASWQALADSMAYGLLKK